MKTKNLTFLGLPLEMNLLFDLFEKLYQEARSKEISLHDLEFRQAKYESYEGAIVPYAACIVGPFSFCLLIVSICWMFGIRGPIVSVQAEYAVTALAFLSGLYSLNVFWHRKQLRNQVDWKEWKFYQEVKSFFEGLYLGDKAFISSFFNVLVSTNDLRKSIETDARFTAALIKSKQAHDGGAQNLEKNTVEEEQARLKKFVGLIVRLGLMGTNEVKVFADGGSDEDIYRARAEWLYRELYRS